MYSKMPSANNPIVTTDKEWLENWMKEHSVESFTPELVSKIMKEMPTAPGFAHMLKTAYGRAKYRVFHKAATQIGLKAVKKKMARIGQISRKRYQLLRIIGRRYKI